MQGCKQTSKKMMREAVVAYFPDYTKIQVKGPPTATTMPQDRPYRTPQILKWIPPNSMNYDPLKQFEI
jgi:hypothetical protein